MSVVNTARRRPASLVTRHSSPTRAFTLIELLVVISILGILAALTVPVLKHFGRADTGISASRQLVDDVARARQLAMSQRTTVYMVFVPTNFWNNPDGTPNTAWVNGLTFAQRTAATNVCDKQLTGYTFIAYGAMGDQPGQHVWHYLAPWQKLPDGSFIPPEKFYWTSSDVPPDFPFAAPGSTNTIFKITRFNTRNDIPFPTETSLNTNVPLPWIAFNYRGQLTTNGADPVTYHELIPLAQGSVGYAVDANKALQFGSPQIVLKSPNPQDWTNTYTVVDVEPLTGRATLEYQKMQ